MFTRRSVVGAVAAFAAFASAGPARAFDIDIHEAITTAAVEQVRRCIEEHCKRWDDLRAAPDPQVASTLRVCNAKQDDIPRKVVLWHFYSQGVPIPGKSFLGWKKLAAGRSFEGFFAGLTERMGKATDAGTIWGTAGAMLHYVQDVAVPAHVNPIFHPTLGYPGIICGDNFDDFEFVPPKATEVSTDEVTCARLLDPSAGGAAPYAAILDATIADTLAAVRQNIPPTLITIDGRPEAVSQVPRTWELFWGTQRQRDGFATYGCGHDSFGEPSFRCRGIRGSTPKVTVARKAYEEFAKQRHRIAIEASVKVIAAAARAAAAAKNPATFVCPVAKKQDGALQMCERAPEWRKDQKCAPVTDTAPVAQRGAPSSSVAPGKPIEGAKPWEIRR